MPTRRRFFLIFTPLLGYNNFIIKQLFDGFIFLGWGMKKFYYEIWLPFTFTKRRILILAIASFIAMC
jgi:hypothetical protein